MRHWVIIALVAIVAAGIGAATALYFTFPNQVQLVGGETRSELLSLNAPPGTLTTEANPAYKAAAPTGPAAGQQSGAVVYAVFLPAFYIPVLLLLFGLIFRGIAFEFRQGAGARLLWDWGFFVGSTVAAFVQGAAVGVMIRGIPVVNNQYAGGPFDWLRPLPVVTGIGLILGYALLGAGWLTLKSEGALRDWAWRRVPLLAGAVLVVLGIAVIAAFVERARMTGNLFLGRPWGFIFPVIGLLALYGVFVAARRRRDSWPFALTAVFFVAALLSLAVMFWPYMIPYTVTVGSAAARNSRCRSCSGVPVCSYCRSSPYTP
jgi:cytochrome bd-type quinol oxidase subunit 2